MKKITTVLMLITLISPVLAKQPPKPTVKLGNWTWQASYQTSDMRLEDGMIKASTFGGDPQIMARNVNIDATKVKALAIRMAITGGKTAQLFFAPWSEKRSVKFEIIPDGKMRTYIVAVGDNAEWKGTIKALRFDPCAVASVKFEIASFRPAKTAKPATLSYDGPDRIIMINRASMSLRAGIVNIGGIELKKVSIIASASGSVDMAEQETQKAVDLLPGKGTKPTTVVKIIAKKPGKGTITLSIIGAGGESKPIDVTVIPVQPVSPTSGTAITTFDTTEGNSEWVSPIVEARPCSDGGDKGAEFDVDNKTDIYLGQKFDTLSAIHLTASGSGDVSAIIRFSDKNNKRLAAVWKLPAKPQTIAISPLNCPGPVTLKKITLVGKGSAQLFNLASARPVRVAMQGKGFFRNENSQAGNYINELGKKLTIKLAGGENSPLLVSLRRIQLGDSAPSSDANTTVLNKAGLGQVALQPSGTDMIGVYDLTVKSPSLEKPYTTRLYLIASDEMLKALHQQSSPAVYGSPAKQSQKKIKPFDFGIKPIKLGPDDAMLLYETDLSPAWLLDIDAKKITLFQDQLPVGLGQPSYIAISTKSGIKVFGPGQRVTGEMNENWILAWHAGAKGWKLWDVPILTVLQHKPTSITRTDDGLELAFDRKCDYLAYMPLYGFYRPPQKGKEILTKQGLPERGIQTWLWSKQLPKDVADKVRWWSQALRKYPIDCDEQFNVDPQAGTITVRQQFKYIDIQDDWKTKPITIAPVSPTLAFTQLTNGFPLKFNAPVTDLDCLTPYGPYMCIEGTDRLSYTVKDLLDYVNEAEIQGKPETSNPGVAKALRLAKETLDIRFKAGPDFLVEFDRASFVWAQLEEHGYPKGLAYADRRTAAKLKAAFVNYYNTFFFGTVQSPADGARGWWRPNIQKKPPNVRDWYQKNTLCIDGPGIHGGLFGDSGKISASAAYNVWSYCHYTGDRNLAKQRWDFLRLCNTNAINMDWKAMGRNSNAESGEHMPPVLAYARLAYLAGDMDSYYFGAYCFMREALMMYAKQRQVGGEYFRLRQPYMTGRTAMPMWALPNHVLGEAAGWIIDAKGYTPSNAGWGGSTIQTYNRWVRFSSEDCARLWREHLRDQTIEELDALRTNKLITSSKPTSERVSFAASMIRLQSYLLDEPADKLLELYPPDSWDWKPDRMGTLMMSLAVIRAAQPRQYVRLIPRDTPASGFVTGLTRIPVTVGWRGLVCFRWNEKNVWPRVRWWKRGGKDLGLEIPHFTFGRITPDGELPSTIDLRQINWVTRVTVFQR